MLVKPELLVPHRTAVSGSHTTSLRLPDMKQSPGSCISPLWLQSRGAGPLFRTLTCDWDSAFPSLGSLTVSRCSSREAHLLDGNLGCSWDTDKYWNNSSTSITKALIPVFLYSIRNNLSVFVCPVYCFCIYSQKHASNMLELIRQHCRSSEMVNLHSGVLWCVDFRLVAALRGLHPLYSADVLAEIRGTSWVNFPASGFGVFRFLLCWGLCQSTQ